MKSHPNRQCPKRPPVHRLCLDSLRIPVSRPCIPITLSKPNLFFPQPCLQTSRAMKHPICHCDQNFCMDDNCNSSTNCSRHFNFCYHDSRQGDNSDADCFDSSIQQHGGCENIQENEFDFPQTGSHSANSEQRDVGESASINEDENNRTPVCPRSYSPSLTNQSVNTTPNHRIPHKHTAETSNMLSNNCLKTCQNRPSVTGVISKPVIIKPSDLSRSLSNVQNFGKTINIENSANKNMQNANGLLDTEICCNKNQVRNTTNLSRLPDSTYVPEDINKIRSYEENAEHNSEGLDYSLYETNPCCRPHTNEPNSPCVSPEELQYFQESQFNDHHTNLTNTSRLNITNQNLANNDIQTTRNIQQDSSTKIEQKRNNTMKRTSMSFQPETNSNPPVVEPLQNTLNLSSPNICEKCRSSSKRISNEGIVTPRSRQCIIDDPVGEYEEHYPSGLGTGNDLAQSEPTNFNTDDRKQADGLYLNPCCVKGATKRAVSRISTASRRSAFMSPSKTNMFHKNSNIQMPLAQGLSNETLRDQSTCCEVTDSRPTSRLNFPQTVTSSNYQKQSALRDSQLQFQTGKKESDAFDNIPPTKSSKQVTGCCSRGISNLIPDIPQRNIKNNSNMQCVCSDVKNNIQCKKKACAHEVGAMTCASTACVANQTSGCRCRYPPAFKQFSCTGNINGSCDCNDDI